MKKFLAIFLTLAVFAAMVSGCAGQNGADNTAGATEPASKMEATAEEIAALEKLYEGRQAYHGDMHGHTSSTEYSDGKNSLADWKHHMEVNQIDFATVVDHRQSLHMKHEDWDDTVFIGGTEPELNIKTVEVKGYRNLDYSMIFANLEDFEAYLNAYPVEYQYYGGRTQAKFTTDHAHLAEMIQSIKDNNGMFVHVHPFGGIYFDPVDMKDYWFADGTGFEVRNSLMKAEQNAAAYDCWVYLLSEGKRIYATYGSDAHGGLPGIETLMTVYSAQKNAEGYLEQMRAGNMTAGPAGIRIAIGDAVTGSAGSFAGKRVVMAVGDFHPTTVANSHTYRLDIYDDKGLVASQELDPAQMNYFAFDAAADAKFYRANIYDVTADEILAVGNPVWNG